MAEIVSMPKMSDTMTEGTIAAWHKKVGDKVESGELMAEIETDKATMEYESYNDGTVLYLGAGEGESVPVDGLLAIVGEEGEDISELVNGGGSAPAAESKEEAPKEESSSAPAEKIDTSGIDAEIVRMPKMSDTMTEGVIAAWHKKVGDEVTENELMAEIETDKATMEYESFNSGTILHLGAEEGGSVAIDGVLAIVGAKGADWETLLKAEEANNSAAPKEEAKSEAAPAPEAKKEAPKKAATASAPAAKSAAASGEKVKASPLAKKLAEEKGYNLADIPGSGPNGRVVKDDVEGFTPSAAPAVGGGTAVGVENFTEIPMNGMRKAIAKNLNSSQFGAPHFYLTMDINMEKAMAARKSMNEIADVKISFNDMVVKACASALKKHPMVNSQVFDDVIKQADHVHIGVAVAINEGLVVPVIRHTDAMSLSQISSSVKDMVGKAKDKKLSGDEMSGSTFTISNLGMFGIEEFTSIINPPASCILAVGGIKQVPVVKDGQIVPGNIMKVTLTCDHRSVDGAIGAAFLQTLKGLMEDPVRILI